MSERAYEDLVGGSEQRGADYFDRSEFEVRAKFEDLHYWHVHRRRVILRELRAFAPAPAGPLIELGCGIGTVATFLNQHGYAVDYSDVFGDALERAAAHASSRLGAAGAARRFLRVDATASIPRRDWIGMLLFDVIEHLPDDERVLRNVHAALVDAPNAFVMVTVPAFQMLWSPWDDIEKHKRRYTRSSLGALLDRSGFEVVRRTYFFSPLFFAALAMKGLRMLRAAVSPPPVHRGIEDLTEWRSNPSLARAMLAVLRCEDPWLARGSLPLGTSILAIARRRPRG